jgi:glycosyltransferase involved in cell wall biosynthesis
MGLPDAIERVDGRGISFWQRAPRTSSPSAPRRYRVGNHVELLRGATTIIRSNPSADLFRGAKAVICLRPTLDRITQRVVEACRRAGALVVADFDDLLFAGTVADWPDVIAGALPVADAERKLAQYRGALALFDAFTTSTAALAEDLRHESGGARVAVVPNGVSVTWWQQGLALAEPKPEPERRPRVVRYLPGSRHDHDFEVAALALGRFMHRERDVVLEVLGPCEKVPSALPPERVRRVPRVPFDHLPRWLSDSWVTIAPLADAPFNRRKSAIKFLESAAFGTPCIATPIGDMSEHVDGGLILAGSDGEWDAAFDRLCDATFYRHTSERGRQWVKEHGTARRSRDALLAALQGWVS